MEARFNKTVSDRRLSLICTSLPSAPQRRHAPERIARAHPAPHAGHLVENWAQKRAVSRYGAGRERRKSDPDHFAPISLSKSPGRKFQTASADVGIPSPPAPYRRFERFRTEKRQHATAKPEHAPQSLSCRKPEHSPKAKKAHPKAPTHRKTATPTSKLRRDASRQKIRGAHAASDSKTQLTERSTADKRRQRQSVTVATFTSSKSRQKRTGAIAAKQSTQPTATKASPGQRLQKRIPIQQLHQPRTSIGTGGNGIHFLDVHPAHALGIIVVTHGA